MKNLLILLVLVAAGYLGYTRYYEGKQGGYDLRSVEQRPIPQEQFYPLWVQVAQKACDDSHAKHNLTREKCREIVTQRGQSCAEDMNPKTPEVIETATLAKQLGREFMECVTPYYFCKGVEVRTEEEARRHCK